eukprot:gene14594-19598_t
MYICPLAWKQRETVLRTGEKTRGSVSPINYHHHQNEWKIDETNTVQQYVKTIQEELNENQKATEEEMYLRGNSIKKKQILRQVDENSHNQHRIALFTVFQVSSNTLNRSNLLLLPSYMNYWAEACGWQYHTLDCYLGVVTSDEIAKQYQSQYNITTIFPCRETKQKNEFKTNSLIQSTILPRNVFIKVFGMSTWSSLLLRKAGIKSHTLLNYKKQIDYKVTYGSLFDFTLKNHSNYSHFGWMDPDVILGNINFFMGNWSWDIYTTYFSSGYHEGTLSGQLTIFKNNEYYRNFWKKAPYIHEKLSGFYEHGCDERVMGAYVYNLYKQKNSLVKLISHDETSLQDIEHRHTGELYFEKGHVYVVDVCNNSLEDNNNHIYPRIHEGVLLHINAMKKKDHYNSCNLIGIPLGWKLNRWNISVVEGHWSFHDSNWDYHQDSDLSCITSPPRPHTNPTKPNLQQQIKEFMNEKLFSFDSLL